jgi:hypothetical protein
MAQGAGEAADTADETTGGDDWAKLGCTEAIKPRASTAVFKPVFKDMRISINRMATL